MSTKRFRLGLDIGGTFTDLVLADMTTGEIRRHKCLTTPDDPAVGALNGVDELVRAAGTSASELRLVIHGTTLVANALIERKGCRTAMLVTEGFRDIVEMGHENRYDIYDLNLKRPAPLVPRELRFQLRERIDAEGAVVLAIDAAQLAEVSRRILDAGVASVAVCLLHSFRNPAHEIAAREALRSIAPKLPISISSEVAPEIREFERMTTTAANAYVQPLIAAYLLELQEGLSRRGYDGRLYLMLSEAGVVSADLAAIHPVRLVESGPAAGVMAAELVGREAGIADVISFDMGGTTAKACLIHGGSVRRSSTLEVARIERFKKGSGLTLQIPSIDLFEIGAGGGSIARVNELGLLKVGPDSAGADPGPACYGRGGLEPTVTDADLVLGYLGASSFLGGRLRLDLNAAAARIEAGVAKPLDLSVVGAAYGIYRVVNENMTSALRVHVAEAGADPRGSMLVAFGGAGPAHACYIARSLKLRGFVCPPGAGVASAFGLLGTPVAFDLFTSVVARLSSVRLEAVEATMLELVTRMKALLLTAGVDASDVSLQPSLDMRYAGQFYEVNVPLHDTALTRDDVVRRFSEAYLARSGHLQRDAPIEILTCRLRGSGPSPNVHVADIARSYDGGAAPTGYREAFFGDEGMRNCPVYSRARLRRGDRLEGPALVEEDESTAVLEPGTLGVVDAAGDLVVEFVA